MKKNFEDEKFEQYEIYEPGMKIKEHEIYRVPLNLISKANVNPRKDGLLKENVENLINSRFFPPISLGMIEGDLIVVDGYHRREATEQMNEKYIEAKIKIYNNLIALEKDAFLSNVNHGVRLSEYDIGMALYKFHIESIKSNPSKLLSETVQEYGIKYRIGYSLFWWIVFTKEILEVNPLLYKKTIFEDYKAILRLKEEIPGKISEEFKIFFKNFFKRHEKLNTEQRRMAVNFFKEGKDYFVEVEKMEKNVEELNNSKNLLNDKNEIGEDEINRNGMVVGNGSGAITSGQRNSFIENIEKEKEEITIDTTTVTKNKKQESINNTLNVITDYKNTILDLLMRDKLKITKNDYVTLQEIVDGYSEIIALIDEKELIKKGTKI